MHLRLRYPFQIPALGPVIPQLSEIRAGVKLIDATVVAEEVWIGLAPRRFTDLEFSVNNLQKCIADSFCTVNPNRDNKHYQAVGCAQSQAALTKHSCICGSHLFPQNMFIVALIRFMRTTFSMAHIQRQRAHEK